MRARFLTVTVLGILGMAAAMAADWPQFRGPNYDGISPETGINKDWKAKPPKEVWKITLGDDGYAGPSVAAGKLYIVDHKPKSPDDILRAVDVATGKDVWTLVYPDADKANYGFTRATPTFDNGKLYILSRLSQLMCVDATKGEVIWKRNIKKEFSGKRAQGDWDYAESPRIDGDRLIVCPGGPGAAMVCLDKATGKDIWKGGGDDQAGYGSTVIATIGGKKQYINFGGMALFGADAQTGAPLWRFPWKTEWDVNAATPLVIGESVFITSNYNHGCALISVGGGKAEKVWENKLLQAHFSTPILVGGYIYGVGEPSKLVCIEAKTGNAGWTQPGFGKGNLIGIDGVLIALNGATGDCIMAKIDPTAYQELGRFKPLGGESWTAPIVADGKLYVRNRSALVCLDIK